jgi:hypothetical protein
VADWNPTYLLFFEPEEDFRSSLTRLRKTLEIDTGARAKGP